MRFNRTRFRRVHHSTLFGAITLALVTSTLVHAEPRFQPLGSLGGSSQAWGISADGAVIVGSSYNASRFEAFRWDADSGMEGLGILSNDLGASSIAWGASADGSVIAGGSTVNFLGQEAFRWTRASSMEGIGDLDGGGPFSIARDVSADGGPAVGAGSSTAYDTEAALWNDTSPEGLGTLIGGRLSELWAISGRGNLAVGWSSSDTQSSRAIVWSRSGGLLPLPRLDEFELSSSALGVSADGSTIVGWSRDAAGTTATRWTGKRRSVERLGNLPHGASNSRAWDVSNSGHIVVGVGVGPDGEEAFIWDPVHGMRSLRDTLIAEQVTGLEGWQLQQATAISDDGTKIAGFGTNASGEFEAFLIDLDDAVPCEPVPCKRDSCPPPRCKGRPAP